ncbi:hypothetical protein [Aliarcobacter butzleri]|uniref:hypothetical protein n=1 Tax=Aliarcobacter butzleri TaxID=28197 RepID=UPI003AF67BF4
MSEQRYDIVDIADDICKETYNFGLFGLKAFYKVSNLEALHQSFNAYDISRFSQTIEVFQYEHEKIDEEKRKEFYQDLKYNEQNLAYLYSMFEKARTSSFLIHSKILAWLSTYLVENKELNYYQAAFLANIDTLNELDFKYFYELLKEQPEIKRIFTNDTITVTIINKFLQIGVLSKSDKTNLGGDGKENKYSVDFQINEFSKELLEVLDLIYGQK